MKKRVLILCTGNSCRSQMAEALWRGMAGEQWESFSAGSDPTGVVHPLAIRALEEAGLDIAHARSKGVDDFVDMQIDLLITVCDSARESCPVLPGVKESQHWPLFDPAQFTGDADAKLACFRRVRDELRKKIESYLAEGRRRRGGKES